MVTVEVSLAPNREVAITRKLPGTVPAFRTPVDEMVPPVAVQVTLTPGFSPAVVSPVATNCTVPPVATLAVAGVTTTFAPAVGRTTTLVDAALPSTVALVDVVPARRPLNLTVALSESRALTVRVSSTLQRTVFTSSSLAAFLGLAVTLNWSPTKIIRESGTTLTLATTLSVTSSVGAAMGTAWAPGVVGSDSQEITVQKGTRRIAVRQRELGILADPEDLETASQYLDRGIVAVSRC